MPIRRSQRHADLYDALLSVYPSLRIEEEYYIGSNLFIDIYLPDYKIAIEIDGRQHDHFVGFFHKEIDVFKLQKLLDKKKETICKEVGITLYRLHYNDNRAMNVIVNEIFASKQPVIVACCKCGLGNVRLFRGMCIDCLKLKKESKNVNNGKRSIKKNRWKPFRGN